MPKAAKRQLSSAKRSDAKAGSARDSHDKSSGAKRKSKNDDSNETKSSSAAASVELASPQLLKRLVDNDPSIRADAITSVARLVSTKRSLDVFDMQKLWKGLWFAMWHCDTPLAQQALARELADLFTQVNSKNIQTFTEAFWTILLREWGTLDRYRINKFYMLVRFVLNTLLTRLGNSGWNEGEIVQFTNQMVSEKAGPLSYGNATCPHSLRLHLIDIYVDELDKVFESSKSIPDASVVKGLLAPVLSQLEYSEFKHIKLRVKDEILTDERLAEWGVVEPENKDAEEASSEDNDGSSDWEGFD